MTGCGGQTRPTGHHIEPQFQASKFDHVQIELAIPHPTFRGALGQAKTGQTNEGVLYPGGHPAVFLLGIAIHGSIVAGQRSSEETAAQAAADAVLSNWSTAIERLDVQTALSVATAQAQPYLPVVVSSTGIAMPARIGAPLMLHLTTEFTVAQNSSTLTARTLVQVRLEDLKSDAVLAIRPARSVKHLGGRREPLYFAHSSATNSAEAFAYQNIVEVVSSPRSITTPTNVKAEELQELVSNLWEQTVVLAVDDLLGDKAWQNSSQQTFRYLRDGQKQFDRGILISSNKERVNFRTLRGWIRSVPVLHEM